MFTVASSLFALSVGGVFALGIYTVLSLKLYSYKDVNLWCRELSSVKAKTLARSLSCKSHKHIHTDEIIGKVSVDALSFCESDLAPTQNICLDTARVITVTPTGRPVVLQLLDKM